MKTAPAFSDVLDAKLHAAGIETFGNPHTSHFEAVRGPARPSATQPLTPSAFEADSAARLAYRFGMGAFHSDRVAVPSAEPPSPTQPVRLLRLDTPARRNALATLQALGARDLGSSSSMSDLKKAFRLLARQFHPDSLVNVSETERARHAALFAEAAQAYRVLAEEQL